MGYVFVCECVGGEIERRGGVEGEGREERKRKRWSAGDESTMGRLARVARVTGFHLRVSQP